MENVSGLLHRKNAKGEKVIEIIKKAFQDLNYAVEVWNLDAAEYGVPQHRNRIFIVGNKFGKTIGKPPITHVIPGKDYGKLNTEGLKSALTVVEAISDLPIIKAGEGQDIMLYTSKPKNRYQKMLRHESAFVFNHAAMKHTKRMVERYREIQSGVVFDSLPDTLKVKKRNGKGVLSDVVYQSNYRHLKPNMISYTIPASFYSNFIHPSIPRNITSREAARLQSFPDWYVFRGKRTQISSKLLSLLGKAEEDNLSQYNQIGNAVPPLLAKAIAKRLKSFLKRNM
jgi:DNA (cytosine-5)-methyltransferase 1